MDPQTPARTTELDSSSISKVRVVLRVRPREICAGNDESCRNESYQLDAFYGRDDDNVKQIFDREVSPLGFDSWGGLSRFQRYSACLWEPPRPFYLCRDPFVTARNFFGGETLAASHLWNLQLASPTKEDEIDTSGDEKLLVSEASFERFSIADSNTCMNEQRR
ncbi:PREDICTED: kinesin-like protein KIN-10B isoform X2 [Camelina sativa]|uniref:Kinesin-like protein KIN-10B isoform X2 n=1 Tax=Camelina sativa TaxID=90675 RepID=A0ABM1QUC7_CAMSA|nr:PREDICTED: kinesin-like protein KIN-10B isoform X2 [Camelina sativa]